MCGNCHIESRSASWRKDPQVRKPDLFNSIMFTERARQIPTLRKLRAMIARAMALALVPILWCPHQESAYWLQYCFWSSALSLPAWHMA
jgi:hypothetical protein